MPELPEVEGFRRLLLPLVGAGRLSVKLLGDKPPRKFLSKDQVSLIHQQHVVKEILRKGKVICIVLAPTTSAEPKTTTTTTTTKSKGPHEKQQYLFLHMGMTGRISTPTVIPKLESITDTVTYPPQHTYLKLSTDKAEACFSDPRKFGSVILADSMEAEFGPLAIDGTEFEDASELVGQSTRIKALLLDQKRVVSGVGNWIADEVLYQAKIHPDQSFLTETEASAIVTTLASILRVAIEHMDRGEEYPSEWLFGHRWNKRAAKHGEGVKDSKGNKVIFITAGGRTSAIVPSIQKLKKQRSASAKKTRKVDTLDVKVESQSDDGTRSEKGTHGTGALPPPSKNTKKTRAVRKATSTKGSKSRKRPSNESVPISVPSSRPVGTRRSSRLARTPHGR